MKILSTSDIHGDFRALKKIIDFVNLKDDIDVVLFCGDIVGEHDFGTVRELAENQMEDYYCFIEMIKDIKAKKVYYILGNHDVFHPDKDDMFYLPNVVRENKEKTFIPFEMVKINYYGISREGDEADILNCLESINEINKNKIVVAHQPPYGALASNIIGINYGSTSIKKFIIKKKPLIYFCGHVHEAFGIDTLGKTLIVNSSCSEDEKRLVVVNTETMEYEIVKL